MVGNDLGGAVSQEERGVGVVTLKVHLRIVILMVILILRTNDLKYLFIQ